MADGYISEIKLPDNKTYLLKDKEKLPLVGGTMTGDITFTSIGSWPAASGETYPISSKGLSWSGSSDGARIFYRIDGSNNGNLIIQTTDDGNEKVIFRTTTANGDFFQINSNDRIIAPINNETGSIGTSSYKWANVYSTNLYGKLTTTRITQPAISGTGTTASDAGASNADTRYRPAIWTFNAGITPTDGDVVNIKQPCAGHDYGTWLTLDNGTTYYPVVYGSSSRVTTHFVNGQAIKLYFDPVGTASVFARGGSAARSTVTGVWRIMTMYDSNSNDTGYYHRRIYPNLKAGTGGIDKYVIIMQLPDGRWSGIVPSSQTTSGSTVTPKATGKTASTNSFLLGHILVMYANATYAENANVGTYNIWSAHTGLIDARYSFNLENATNKGFVGYKPVYIVGTVTDGLFTLDSTKWWTQTLPSSEDNKVYIYIGDAYDWYRMTFTEDKPIYWYKDGAIRLYAEGRSINKITRSGTTFTATRDDGSTFTFTQQDNAGITSVTIGATSPVQSSTSTAQTGSSASTTISLKDAYGDTKNPYGSKTKNYVLAAPSDANGAPSFRALIAADIPNLSWNKITYDKPTTLSGYGITDAASSDHSHTLKIGNKSLSVSTAEQTWSMHDILYDSSNIIGTSTSWDIIESGIYAVTNSSHDGLGHPGSTTGQVAPYSYGHLIVTRANGYGAAQIYISHVASSSTASNKGIRYRSGWNVNNTDKTHDERWQPWATILDDKNYSLFAWKRPTSITTGQVLISSGTDGTTTLREIENISTAGTNPDASTKLITSNTLLNYKGTSNISTVGTITNDLVVQKGTPVIKALGTNSSEVSIILERNNGTNTVSSWKLLNNSGTLYLQNNWKDSRNVYENYITFAHSTGNITINKGSLTLASDPTSDMHAATKKYVDALIGANDALVYKGVIAGNNSSDNGGTLTVAASQGHVYKVSTAGYINGMYCEVGDMLICVTDTDVATTSNYNTIKANWNVIQTSDGSVSTSETSVTDSQIPIFSGATGRFIKNSSKSFSTATPTSSSTDAQIPTSKAVWAAIDALDGNLNSTSAGASKTLTAFSQTNGKVSATFGDIAINESAVTWSNNTLYPIGDDIYIGDVNTGGHLGLKSKKATYDTGLAFIKQGTDDDSTSTAKSGTSRGFITWNGTKFTITSTTPVVADISGTSGTTKLLKPISDTTTASASTWNIPSGSYQVWGERFSDTRLKYTPEGGTETTITDTGDWTMWLTPTSSGTATLNMRIDGTYYGGFNGNLSGNATTATNANNLVQNSRMDYNWNGINYFNINGYNQSTVKVNDTPTGTSSSKVWWHILRFNHANSSGYYTDLAVPFNANSLYYKRVGGGTLQNSTTNGGWVKILDQLNTYVASSNTVSVTCGTDATLATINGTTVKINVAVPSASDVGAATSSHTHTEYVQNKAGNNDVNTLYDTGIYNMTSGSATNTPKNYGYGQLLTMSYRKHRGNEKPDWASQIYLHCGSANGVATTTAPGNVLYFRTSNSNATNSSPWHEWRKVVHVLGDYTKVGDTTQPVYIAADGTATACTSYANASVNYATSAGTAASASKLIDNSNNDYSAGSSGMPVYFTGGVPVQISYLNVHQENNGVIIPFLFNDLAHLVQRGGSYEIYNSTATDFTPLSINKTALSIDLSNAFDGTQSYASISTTNTTTIIDIVCPETFTYTTRFYIDFGSVSWRAKDIQVLVYKNGTDTTYTSKGSVTNLVNGYWVCSVSHKDGTGFDRLRIVLSNYNGTIKRIAQIGLVGYGKPNIRTAYMSRGIDDGVWRSITPASGKNNTYDLGSSSVKWKGVYATNLYGNLDWSYIQNKPTYTAADVGAVTKLSSSTDNAVVRFDGTTGDIQDSTATISDSGTMNIKGKLIVNPSYDTSNSYNEGIRINIASNGWSNIHLGAAADSTSSTSADSWLIGRRGSAGSKVGAIGDLTIENNGSTGTGLTLHKSSGGVTLYSKLAYNKSQLKIWNDNTIEATRFGYAINAISTMAANSNSIILLGAENSTKNQAYLGFHYEASGSNSNYLTLGFYSVDHLVKVFPTGQMNITKDISSSSTSTGSLVVAGGTGIAGKLYVGAEATVKNITTTNTDALQIKMGRSNYNWIQAPTNSSIAFCVNDTLSGSNGSLQITGNSVSCYNNEIASLGTTSVQWNGTYSKNYIVDQQVTLQYNSTDQALEFIFA